MPINDKQRHFIREYTSNGHNATKAYKTAYPDCNGGWDKLGARLMGNDGIRAEISKIEAKSAAKSETTVETIQEMYQKGFDVAEKQGNSAGMATNTTGIARLYGMDKATVITEHTPDQPTGHELEALEDAAREYKVKLAENTA
jgi:hypothetical protein